MCRALSLLRRPAVCDGRDADHVSALLFVRNIKRNSWAGYRGYVIAGPWAAYAYIFGILMLPVQWLSLFVFE